MAGLFEGMDDVEAMVYNLLNKRERIYSKIKQTEGFIRDAKRDISKLESAAKALSGGQKKYAIYLTAWKAKHLNSSSSSLNKESKEKEGDVGDDVKNESGEGEYADREYSRRESQQERDDHSGMDAEDQ